METNTNPRKGSAMSASPRLYSRVDVDVIITAMVALVRDFGERVPSLRDDLAALRSDVIGTVLPCSEYDHDMLFSYLMATSEDIATHAAVEITLSHYLTR